MRNCKFSALVFGLTAAFLGCAAEPDLNEGSISSDVREEADNFVLACGGLALRTFDHPNATVKDTLPYGSVVHVGQVDWDTRMANIVHTAQHPTSGWMRIDGANGPLLSTANSGCN
jgi:hypothetical protein